MYFAIYSKKKILSSIAMIVAIVLCVLCLHKTGAHAVFSGSNLRELPIYRVETTEKKIAISFDCAWGTDYTDTLLSIMKEENVKCTFFMVEFWTKKHSDYVKKYLMLGMK